MEEDSQWYWYFVYCSIYEGDITENPFSLSIKTLLIRLITVS